MQIQRLLALSLALAVAACGDRAQTVSTFVVDTLPGGVPRTMSSAPMEPGRWQLELLREVQPAADAPGELMEPQSLAIADDGSVIVADTRPAVIKVFGPDGSYQRSFGREGAGPGEFRVAWIALRGDTLVVQDPTNSRATLFNWRDGTVLRSQPTACCFWVPIDVDGSRRAWLRLMAPLPDTTVPFGQGFIRLSLAGGATDTVFAYERRDLPKQATWALRVGGQTRLSMPVPFTPQVHWTVDPAGGLLSGWSGEYSIRVSRNGQDSVAVFGRRWTPQRVESAEQNRVYETIVKQLSSAGQGLDEISVRNSFDKAAMPSTRPAYDFIHADDAGRRWVRYSSGDSTRASFDLFDPQGRWLDSVAVPASQWMSQAWAPADFGRDAVAISVEGEDGRPLIRVFAIRRR